MSILTNSEIITELGASSYTDQIEFLHLGIEQMIKNATGKPLESTSYFELYDGKGGFYRLQLKQIPVTSVSRISVDLESVIKIKNTTLSTTASVKVDNTNVTLVIDNTTSTLAITSYPTLSSLVTAINLLSASGWVAEIYDTDYDAKLTNKLIAQQFNCTSFTSVMDYDYLYMGEPVNFKFISETNSVEAYFPYGSQNIGVNYIAGSSPADIKMAVINLVKSAYDRKTNDADGIKRFTVGDIATEYFTGISEMPFIQDVINRNRKVTI